MTATECRSRFSRCLPEVLCPSHLGNTAKPDTTYTDYMYCTSCKTHTSTPVIIAKADDLLLSSITAIQSVLPSRTRIKPYQGALHINNLPSTFSFSQTSHCALRSFLLLDTMPANNRSAGRNVFIYDSENPTKVLGGLILTNGVTNANFYFMVEILFIFTTTFELQLNEGNAIIPRDGNPLQAGNYYIITSRELLHQQPFIYNSDS